MYISTSFFFNATPTTEIYTLSLHDALPISSPGSEWTTFPRSRPSSRQRSMSTSSSSDPLTTCPRSRRGTTWRRRSEEHTSELQSQFHLVCRLLLEKKKKKININRRVTTDTQ